MWHPKPAFPSFHDDILGAVDWTGGVEKALQQIRRFSESSRLRPIACEFGGAFYLQEVDASEHVSCC
jgi:hypothetical protein